MATKNYKLATKIFELVASRLLIKKLISSPGYNVYVVV